MTPDIDHILNSYLRASDDMVLDGMTWYRRARDFCLTLDENLERAAGIVAVISANTGWNANKTLALKAYQGDMRVGFPDKVRKVTRIFAGEAPETVVKGQKVESFFACIIDPDANMPAVIDRHAFDIAVNQRHMQKSRPLGKRAYAEFQAAYATVADIVGISTPQLQAITWVEWRARHDIRV